METSTVAICRGCGALQAASCRDDKEHLAKLVSQWVKDDLKIIDELPNEIVRAGRWECTCEASEKCEDLSCGEPATYHDVNGIPLCKFHYDDLEPPSSAEGQDE